MSLFCARGGLVWLSRVGAFVRHVEGHVCWGAVTVKRGRGTLPGIHPSIYSPTHPAIPLGPSGIRHQIDTRHDMSRVSRGRQIDRCQIPTPVGLELSVRSYSPSRSDGSDCVPFDLCCLSISSSPVRTPRNPTDRAGDCWGALSCQAFASVGKPP